VENFCCNSLNKFKHLFHNYKHLLKIFSPLAEPINKRIQEIIHYSGESNNRFASRIGTSSAVISHIMSGRNKPNIDLIYKLARTFPNMNIEWLLLGKGAMLLDKEKELKEAPRVNEKPADTQEAQGEQIPDEEEAAGPSAFFESLSGMSAQWTPFLSMVEQMMEAQRKSYQSMEQQIAAQQAMVRMLKQWIDGDKS